MCRSVATGSDVVRLEARAGIDTMAGRSRRSEGRGGKAGQDRSHGRPVMPKLLFPQAIGRRAIAVRAVSGYLSGDGSSRDIGAAMVYR